MTVTRVAGLLAAVGTIGIVFTWIARAEDAHKEHEVYENRFRAMVDATRDLQERDRERDMREQIRREVEAEYEMTKLGVPEEKKPVEREE